MSKGSWRRPCDKRRFDENFEDIFGKKKLNVWDNPSSEEEPDEIQRDPRNGARDRIDGRGAASVPQESGGGTDPQAAEPVESPQERNLREKRADGTPFWHGPGYRGEYTCPHGVGHGNHVHGCCPESCCQRDDFPLRKAPR